MKSTKGAGIMGKIFKITVILAIYLTIGTCSALLGGKPHGYLPKAGAAYGQGR
jgi:hypothetical protein